MLSYTPPHQRGFGTQSRFMRAEVGRATALPPSPRFTMNDAINCALQNLPDKQSPGPAACAAAAKSPRTALALPTDPTKH